jgi:AraC-like DNA-binding protein
MMTEHPLNAVAAAERIGIHRRTLSRWLQSEGTSFKRIADEARFGVAKQLLADTNMSLAEISAALGFSEPAASGAGLALRQAHGGRSSWRLNGLVPRNVQTVPVFLSATGRVTEGATAPA